MPFLIAFGVAIVATPLCMIAGRAVGLVDRPAGDGLKIHERPVPLTGGVALSVATLVGAATVGHVPWWLSAGVGSALLLGTVDDIRSLPPWLRLAGQAAIGGVLVMGGLRLEPLGALGALGVVVEVIACTNAVNLMDGQDGLAGGLGAIAALGLAGLLPAGGGGQELALATTGATAAFLVWNRPPARIFLGDGGSYALGTLLAVLAATAGRAGWPQLLAVVVCLGVFVAELLTTIVRRIGSGRSLVLGDRDHAYDVTARRLGSRTRSTVLFWALGAASALVATGIEASRMGVGIALTAAYGCLALAAGALLRRQAKEMA